MSGEPKQADDGKLWTPGAVDFFRIVNEQVSVVEEVSSGEMLLQTGEAVMGIMKEFQVRPCIQCLPMWQVMWRRRYVPKEQQLSRRHSASPAVQLLLQTDILAESSSLPRTSGMPKACPSIQSVQGLQHCKSISSTIGGRADAPAVADWLQAHMCSHHPHVVLLRVQQNLAGALARHEAGQH